MRRLLLAVIVSALAGCEPVYATAVSVDAVVVVPVSEFTALRQAPDVVPLPIGPQNITGIYTPAALDFGFCDPLPVRDTPPDSEPLRMLAGSTWTQGILPTIDGVVQSYPGGSFNARFYPQNPVTLPVDLLGMVTDWYSGGENWQEWKYTQQFQDYPYTSALVDGTHPDALVPAWRSIAVLMQDATTAMAGHLEGWKLWRFVTVINVDTSTVYSGLPLHIQSVPVSGGITVSMSPADTALISGMSGRLWFEINRSDGLASGISAPLEVIPTVTRLP